MKKAINSRSLATSTARLAVVYRPISQLKLNPNNPRNHSRTQIGRIARSMKSFGCVVPVLVDRHLNVIAGHGRIMACQQLGCTEVPTITLEHLNDTQVRAFMIADNRLSDMSEWNDRLLGEQLRALAEVELDFDLEVTGFDMGEIDLRIEGLSDPSEPRDNADELSPPQSAPPVTRLGDLWLMGEHRVYCGNSLEATSYATLMNAEQASMAFTDAPYNDQIEGNVTGLGSTHHREFVMASGEMTALQFKRFLSQAFYLLAYHSRDGSLHYICMDWRHAIEILAAGREVYEGLKALCVWVKSNSGMGSLYRSQHELVFVYKHGRGQHRNNIQLGKYGRNRSNVWQYPGNNSFARNGEEGNLRAVHPTVKPVALVSDAIMDCTARGDIVLDSFLGAGTTAIAAERTGRRCFGIEIDPIYVDTAIRRWQTFTGETARHATSGLSFAALEIRALEHHG